jgi:hypothetical protein
MWTDQYSLNALEKPAGHLGELPMTSVIRKHYADKITNVRSDWIFHDPAPLGTAYAQELPRDGDRYFGIRVAFASR